jgi:hypothetical protein
MTAQIHERLILDGEETSMACCPALPEGHPRIVEKDRRQGDDDPSDSMLGSTACWRGYQGTWQIKEGRFYLLGLQGRYRLTGREPLFADWFSGVLRIPQGELLHYVHMGFASVYESEEHIAIERGIVTDTREIDNRRQSNNPDEVRNPWELPE